MSVRGSAAMLDTKASVGVILRDESKESIVYSPLSKQLKGSILAVKSMVDGPQKPEIGISMILRNNKCQPKCFLKV